MIGEIYESGFMSIRENRSFFAKASAPSIVKPTLAKARPYLSGKPWQPWKDDNLWPVTVKNALDLSPEAQICLDVLITYTYGNGLGVFITTEEGGKKVKKPVYDVKKQEWLRQVNAYDYCVKAITDYWTLANFWPQFIPSVDRKTIANIRVIDAPFCRMGKYDPKLLRVPDVYISGTWHNMPTDEFIDIVPITDKYNAEDTIRSGTAKRIMYQGYSYTPGELFYHEHPWHALINNGTLEIAGKLPDIRKRMIDNSMFIKYHVEIDQGYWAARYGDTWPTDPKEQAAKKTEVYQEIDKKLTGSANAFKSLFTEKRYERDGNVNSLVKITPMGENAGRDASFWADIMATSAQIFVGMGVPPPTVGPVLSDTKSRGGGSDIRESKDSLISRLVLHRRNILEPLEFAMRYSGLLEPSESLEFEDTIYTTLDQNPTGSQNIVK